MNLRANIMDPRPAAPLPRFATVESLIGAMRPVEPVYALFPDKFCAVRRGFATIGD